MQTRDHIKLAKYIWKRNIFAISNLHYGAFILGNIMPDINIFTYIVGHIYENSYSFIKKKIKKIIKSDTFSIKESYELGVVSHYIADYFTFPHNYKFSGSLKEHCNYEKKLNQLFEIYINDKKVNVRKIELESSKDIFRYIEVQHNDYIENYNSMRDDCNFILKVCSNAIRGIYRKIEEKQFYLLGKGALV